jgi:hypothetical protein
LTDLATIAAKLRAGLALSDPEIAAIEALAEWKPVPAAVLAQQRRAVFEFSQRLRPRRPYESTYWHSAVAAHDFIHAYLDNEWPNTGLRSQCPHPPESAEAAVWALAVSGPINRLRLTKEGYLALLDREAKRQPTKSAPRFS